MIRITSGKQLLHLSQSKGIFVQVLRPDSYMWLRVNGRQALQVLREVKADGLLKLEAFDTEHSLDLVIKENP